MGVTLNVPNSSGNEHKLNARDIIIPTERPGRYAAPKPETVRSLLASIKGQAGQIQSIGVRFDAADRLPILIYGGNRLAAFLQWYDEIDAAGGPQNVKDTDKFQGYPPIRAKILDITEEDALLLSIQENLNRTDPNAMDTAINIDRLSRKLGWADGQIAEYYGEDNSFVSRHRKLLSLPKKYQDKIADGTFNLNSALALCETPSADREAVVENVVAKLAERKEKGEGRASVTRAEVSEAITELGVKTQRPVGNTTASLKKVIKKELEKEELPKGVVKILSGINEFYAGKITAETLIARIKRNVAEDMA